MIGKMLTRQFLQAIDTMAMDTEYATQFKTYECLDMAAGIFFRETRLLHRSVEIKTVAGQQSYNLPADFIDLYIQDSSGRYAVRYDDGTTQSYPALRQYDDIFLDNRTDRKDYPDYFAVTEISPDDVPTLISGTASSAGTASGGRSVLEDTTKNFVTLNVQPRDMIGNDTDASVGIVLDVVSTTKLGVDLFEGTKNAWTKSDAYSIRSAIRQKMILSDPPLTSDYVITVPYVCLPAPVYWDYGVWPISDTSCRAIADGAASLFKTGKMEYVEAKALSSLFADEIRRIKMEMGMRHLKQGTGRHRRRYF